LINRQEAKAFYLIFRLTKNKITKDWNYNVRTTIY
jgi:hypothetical protein